MMTWITAHSLFDSVESLDTPQLALSFSEAESAFMELVLESPSEQHGPMPATLRAMWAGHEIALAAYATAAAATLVAHGVTVGTRALVIAETVARLRANEEDGAPLIMPPWFGDQDIMRSHRSNLMRRFPKSYSWRRTPTDLPYIWPVLDGEGGYVLRISKPDKELIASGQRSIPSTMKDRISNA